MPLLPSSDRFGFFKLRSLHVSTAFRDYHHPGGSGDAGTRWNGAGLHAGNFHRGALPGEVEVSAEGLPAGVKATVISDAKGITLRLGAEMQTGGSFRIVGKAKGPAKLQRIATASLKVFGETADLWLTVVAGGVKK